MTKKELFNRLVLHMLAQGRPAKHPTLNRRYRIQVERTVLKSPLGFIIPDQLYSQDMEDMSVQEVLDIIDKGELYKQYIELLVLLQGAHANPSYEDENCKHFISILDSIALTCKIDTKLLTQFYEVTAWKVAKEKARKIQKQLGY